MREREVVQVLAEGRALGDVTDLALELEAPPALSEVTTLACRLFDQRARAGLINRLHDSGLAPVSVERLAAWP